MTTSSQPAWAVGWRRRPQYLRKLSSPNPTRILAIHRWHFSSTEYSGSKVIAYYPQVSVWNSDAGLKIRQVEELGWGKWACRKGRSHWGTRSPHPGKFKQAWNWAMKPGPASVSFVPHSQGQSVSLFAAEQLEGTKYCQGWQWGIIVAPAYNLNIPGGWGRRILSSNPVWVTYKNN